MPKLTLCIPTMNRWNFLQKNLPVYLENPYIDEIVVCDENGEDVKKINENFTNPKLKVFTNSSRLGSFFNKRQSVVHASNEWVCLIDSDNLAPLSYFEAWFEFIGKNGLEKKIIYSPSFTIPQANHPGFDFRHLMNEELTLDNTWNIFKKRNVETLLNCGNYIVNKDLFLEASGLPEYASRCLGLCSIFKNYLLLRAGGRLQLVPNMSYHHIVHDGSYYVETHRLVCVNDFNNLYRDKL